jgi:YD repeat-containing protein
VTSSVDEGFALETRPVSEQRTQLAFVDGSTGVPVDACTLTIDDLEVYVDSEATMRVAGIGNVETLPSHRRRGLATALMSRTIDHMRARGFAASLLYGIDDFYDRFGWRDCGDERWVVIDRERALVAGNELPTVRAMHVGDRDALQRVYHASASRVPGSICRRAIDEVWTRLDVSDVLVTEDAAGRVIGYVWHGHGQVAERDAAASRRLSVDVWAELHAETEAAALALVRAACSRESDAAHIMIGAPDQHVLRRVVRSGVFDAVLEDVYRPQGGAMLLVLDEQLVHPKGSWYQFLPDRF